jgi:tetraacyldisaccharide 4'-kinase
MLKTPDFWTKRNWISYLLLPLSFIYFCVFYLMYFFGKKAKISKPVICVGNLIAGGSGKTPTAIALGKILQEMNLDFAYLSRGFMRDGSKFLMLRKGDNNKAEQVGDEPLLLIETAPTFVSQDRLFGARQIESMKRFDLIVLDDGMQNNSIKSDFYILVVDGKIGFGNEFLIPAGPMRQSIKSGLEKSDLIVVIGDLRDDLKEKLSGKKIIQARIKAKNLEEFQGKKLLAFCGLAYPQKFFSFLREQNLEIAETVDFPDHYLYRQNDLESLVSIAKRDNLKLITTKKDWVKFPKNFQDKISYLAVELEFEDVEAIKNELKRIL